VGSDSITLHLPRPQRRRYQQQHCSMLPRTRRHRRCRHCRQRHLAAHSRAARLVMCASWCRSICNLLAGRQRYMQLAVHQTSARSSTHQQGAACVGDQTGDPRHVQPCIHRLVHMQGWRKQSTSDARHHLRRPRLPTPPHPRPKMTTPSAHGLHVQDRAACSTSVASSCRSVRCICRRASWIGVCGAACS
jgi:hypothetical protein